jgi:hypothetical protein
MLGDGRFETVVSMPLALEYEAVLAEREAISLNQFIALAVAEKMSALLTSTYLEERANRGSRAQFRRILARVPDVEPAAGDAVEEPRKAPRARTRVSARARRSNADRRR